MATSSKHLRSARSRGRESTVKRRTATYPRSLRVNQVLRQVVAEELERLADADERFRMITVTSVDTKADMRNATVYLASMDDEAAEALEERRPQLQKLIGSQVTMKRTPRLTFKADPAIVAGSRVEELLRGMDRQGWDRDDSEDRADPDDE
jgi:ribosome-binding factor A